MQGQDGGGYGGGGAQGVRALANENATSFKDGLLSEIHMLIFASSSAYACRRLFRLPSIYLIIFQSGFLLNSHSHRRKALSSILWSKVTFPQELG